ncbi:MAG: PHP domain-containing protein [Patescibacteria group bacterium]
MIDLHIHSSYSDGVLDIKELSKKILNAGISYCSLTDHDNIDGVDKMAGILQKNKVYFINGVELSALYKNQEIHLLIYNFNLPAVKKIIQERNRLVGGKKIKELETTIKLFKKQGFIMDNTLIPESKKPIGFTVAWSIYHKKENQKLLIKKHGHLLNMKEFFDYYQAAGRPCYTQRSGVNLDWILDKFHNISRDIILAHPFSPVSFVVKPLEDKDIYDLIKKGITGIEIYHNNTPPKKIRLLERIVKKNNFFYTGGSDSHSKSDDTSLGYYNHDSKIPSFRLSNLSYKI